MAAKRNRWTQAHACKVVTEFEASGKTPAEYGRLHGLDPERIRRWRVCLGRNGQEEGPRFVELVAKSELVHGRVQVHCPSGHVVEVVGIDVEVGLRAALAAAAAVCRTATC